MAQKTDAEIIAERMEQVKRISDLMKQIDWSKGRELVLAQLQAVGFDAIEAEMLYGMHFKTFKGDAVGPETHPDGD